MLDAVHDRLTTYRLARVADCWGRPRAIRVGSRHGVWFLDPGDVDVPRIEREPEGDDRDRAMALAAMDASGRFTPTEVRTLRALILDGLTIDEIAQRDGCSRQAVMARLVGNSRGQGGILKKARRLRADGGH
jgi:hypothetical protein